MTVGALEPGDRARWTELWRGYLDFYEATLSPEIYEHTWSRLMSGEIGGLAAREGGAIVGITHFLRHASAWTLEPVVYLQDLFTDPQYRGKGVGRALIEAVAAQARSRGDAKLYWLTKADNAVARGLYDRVARHSGFIRYEFPL